MKKIFFILIPFVLCLCTPQQRLNHLLKKHPELLKNDTVTLIDTIIRDGFTFDTTFNKDLFMQNIFYDTVTIVKNNVVTKIFTKHDTIQVSTIVKGDTIIKKIPIPVVRIIYQKKEINFLWYVITFLLGCAVMALIITGVSIRNQNRKI